MTLGPAPRAPFDGPSLALCGEPTEPHAPLIRGPYLQKVGARVGHVVFTSRVLRAPAVWVWPAGQVDEARSIVPVVDASAPLPVGAQYVAAIDVTGGAVCYEVRDSDRVLAGPYALRPPPASNSEPVRMIAIGDMGYPSPDQRAVLEQMRTVEADLVLLAGDIAYPFGTLLELESHFFSVYAELMHRTPFFPASGNHDYETDDALPFRQAFVLPENGGVLGRERWYSFDWGRVHVTVLDTERIDPAQLDWLDQDLTLARASGADYAIVVLHKPAFSSGEHGPVAEVITHILPILERHEVPLVLGGHDHHYERFEPQNGVVHIVTGGGGRGTRRVSATSATAYAAQVAHFVYLIAGPDQLSMWAIDASGQTFDTAVIEPW